MQINRRIALFVLLALFFTCFAILQPQQAQASELTTVAKKSAVVDLNKCYTSLDHWGSYDTYNYTGKAIKPKVKVYDENGKTIKSSLYKVKYSNNILPNAQGDSLTKNRSKVVISPVKGKSKGKIESYFEIQGQRVYSMVKLSEDNSVKCNFVYTNNSNNISKYEKAGYVLDGVFISAFKGTAVHELYNKKFDTYQYTSNKTVIKKLKKAGYKDNGTAFYSDPRKTIGISNYSDIAYTKWNNNDSNFTSQMHYVRSIEEKNKIGSSVKFLKLRYITGYIAAVE